MWNIKAVYELYKILIYLCINTWNTKRCIPFLQKLCERMSMEIQKVKTRLCYCWILTTGRPLASVNRGKQVRLCLEKPFYYFGWADLFYWCGKPKVYCIHNKHSKKIRTCFLDFNLLNSNPILRIIPSVYVRSIHLSKVNK